ncbi:MAG: right-handed parallel beta-helix repeat-containing protein [Verrucomicrobia bacterium]|nr:right-handed parallel beta-helix repeat-containing protein [Verrucomicrobiota bacterium]
MKKMMSFKLAMTTTFLVGILPSALAAKTGDPIPGYTFRDGIYQPNEPYREGQPRVTGLQQPYPKMKSVEENPITPAKVQLGKLLYFDPILSGDNTTSCAHCHHPDFGFSDGRHTSMGLHGQGLGPERSGGDVLARGAPVIWNAAYSPRQFWDGRGKDLEQQAEGPIQDAHEMNQNAGELVQELLRVPEYVRLFQETFGGKPEDAVTFRNVTKALASFERTILSFNSKFDRYAAGDSYALNDSEKRGLQLFRSLKTRCFECHALPNFSDGSFRVIGVPDQEGQPHDLGRAKVPGQGPEGAFKVPTLRNVALSAPYMHNGHFATLEDVIKFYSKGGGHQFPNQTLAIDDKIGTFEITPEETADLVAFLQALTDTSLLPDAPTKVPSGLPVLAVKSKPTPAPKMVVENRSRREEAQIEKPEVRSQRSDLNQRLLTSSPTITVKPGQSIQAAVDRAKSGDRIEVFPGVYNQSVMVDKAGISLIGVHVNGERPVLDGENKLGDAVQGSGDHFLIQGFHIRNYTGNGVVNNKASHVTYRDLIVENPGLYAVYPVECSGVLVEGCVVSGAKDAGIYVGQSRDIIVRNNEVFHNVAGIEIENSVRALVANNSAHHNTAGILVFLLPNNPSKVGSHTRVVNNRSWENNHDNFGKPGTTVSFLPPGLGMFIMAADHTEVTQNEIFGNNSQGIQMISYLTSQVAPKDKIQLDIEPNSDNNFIHDNLYRDNGRLPAKTYVDQKIPGGDVAWDGTGVGNGWQEAPGVKTYPTELPKQSGLERVDFSKLEE